MRKNKRIWIIFAAVLMIFLISGCGGGKNKKKPLAPEIEKYKDISKKDLLELCLKDKDDKKVYNDCVSNITKKYKDFNKTAINDKILDKLNKTEFEIIEEKKTCQSKGGISRPDGTN
jgi:hypothetical protein